jgi:glycosyltransferase involved in cell wall biosynthesis
VNIAMGRRILIDALAARYGGTAAATVQLARHLATNPRVSTVAVVTRRGSIVEHGLAREEAVRCVALPASRHVELIRRIAWEAFRLPALARREKCDAIISMSGMLPRSPRSPRSPRCRVMCVLANPVMYESNSPANLLRRWAVRRTAREADHLSAPSRYMADMVSASAKRPCAVEPWGVDHRIFSPAASAGEEILYVADFKAYKRHDLIIEAWLRLPTPRPLLRFVGNPDVEPQAHTRLMTRIATLAEADHIRMEYRVPHEQMPDIYRCARVFVMPSEHESFCMPVPESMACGVPAVARGIRCLRETGGAGARYLDTDDPAEWAAAVKGLMEDDGEHDRARRLAIGAAARFTWESFAESLAAQL